ncbi:hypothetical protein AVEN_143964-1 [Araneus ventricosus]|uniref:Secreted protein n=1 Tax=Araneus ventricosus TaxID=182803 RepID=A0A4Y2A851_ARAVE|nr:hypothetical protein AVEN_143964-1 [Araneus ventricosus]
MNTSFKSGLLLFWFLSYFSSFSVKVFQEKFKKIVQLSRFQFPGVLLYKISVWVEERGTRGLRSTLLTPAAINLTRDLRRTFSVERESLSRLKPFHSDESRVEGWLTPSQAGANRGGSLPPLDSMARIKLLVL